MGHINLIGCRGGFPNARKLLEDEGWYYGFRSDYTPYGWPFFIDINWENYNWGKHLAVLEYWRPAQAMAVDYLAPEKRGEMLSQVEDIRALGIRPMVCPKFSGAVAHIPQDCIIAVSVPTTDEKYGGFLPNDTELVGRELHLLGGHPDQFIILINRYSQSLVVSIDCSTIFQKAFLGAYWSGDRNTWRYIKHRFSTNCLIRMSARTVKRYLENPRPNFKKDRNRLSSVGFRLQPFLFEV